VLKEFGGLLSCVVRKSDCAARVGGDEFGLILPETDPEGAKAIAVRVVKETAEHHFCSIDDRPLTVRIRVSCGIASYPADFGSLPSEDSDELCGLIFDLADAALYAAKERGRGMAVAAGELTSEERAKHILVREK
jgi:diguanylate cyclase (GGDEF)-like protein